MVPATIRLLGPGDAAAWLSLRLRALREHPTAFTASPEEDARLGEAGVARHFAAPATEAVHFGAFDETGALVGVAHVARSRGDKTRHTATLWGMYVTPDHRRTGLSRRLMETAIAATRAMPGVTRLCLAVDITNAPARRLYDSLGFEPWGVEKDAFRAGRSVDEEHRVLAL